MSAERQKISLAGEWVCRLDHADTGVSEQWYKDTLSGDVARLPGSLTENLLGDDVTMQTPWVGRIRDTSLFDNPRYEPYRQPGNIKVPFWLTPLKYYKGAAWFQRDVEIPEEWHGQVVHLRLERVHWTSRIWVDGVEAGFRDSLSTPHEYVLTGMKPGRHRLTLQVDNRMYVDVGEDANSVSDHSQTNWNGVIGEVSLWATPLIWIHNVNVFPSADRQSVRVVTAISNAAAPGRDLQVRCILRPCDPSYRSSAEPGERTVLATEEFAVAIPSNDTSSTVEHTLALSEPADPWGEFSPALYELHLQISSPDGMADEKRVRFGFRQFKARGTRFYLNDKPVYLRGTLEDCIFPLTGYPPTDKAAWARIMRVVKEHGLNNIRFHSWCPPRAAFDAADEAGMILSVECASWTTVGYDDAYDQWLYREAAAILREYGNHPSFCMMLYGNEPYGDRASEFLGKFVEHLKHLDSRHLYSGGTAWPQIPENDFHIWADPRIQLWDQNLDSRINAAPPETGTDYREFVARYDVPVISHEIGQWCVYPNFDEIPKYTGALRAYNFEIFRDFLAQAGMSELAPDFLMASGRLQVLCYKEEIESALRTPGMGGFQLLDLHDFSGQGTALVGVLDAFSDPKPYIDAEEYREFAGPIVALARMPKRVFTNDEDFSAQLLISHFGSDPIAGKLSWSLANDDVMETSDDPAINPSGEIALQQLQPGDLYELGAVRVPLRKFTAAQKLTLQVELPGGEDTAAIRNSWDIWVYPARLTIPQPAQVHVTRNLDASALHKLQAGGRVLLLPDLSTIAGDARGQVPPGFSSIFWNTAWTQGQAPHTLGILCDPAHPALRYFPTEYHSNWQWWYIVTNARAMILNGISAELQPIVRVIDDWFTARRLGLIVECKHHGGSLLVCSVDLWSGLSADQDQNSRLDPVRHQLLYSLMTYISSPDFAPTLEVTAEELSQCFHPR